MRKKTDTMRDIALISVCQKHAVKYMLFPESEFKYTRKEINAI